MTNEELDKLFGSFCLEGKISGKHAMEIKEILKSNSRNIFAAPMGVSQWREHGKTYKYWSYFRNEVIDECTDIFYEPTLDIKPKLGIPKKIHLGALIRTNIFLYYADDIIKKLNKLKSPTSNPK